MLKKIMWMFTAGCLVVCPGLAFAGETDLLVQKLVEKGILTPYEAQILRDDIRQDVNKQIAEQKNDAIPSWIQSVKVKGDLRLRYQTQETATGSTNKPRNRARYRMRLGIEGKPNDALTIGAGFATGTTSDPRSTNQSMDDGFNKDNLNLDYAWAEYKPNGYLSLIGGKYAAKDKNYVWYTTDMMWDSDITHEGASAHVDLPKILGGDVFLNAGYWSIDEDATETSDLGMYYGQVGTAYSINAGLEEPLKLTLAGALYGVKDDHRHTRIDHYQSSNTMNGTQYAYKFSNIGSASGELVYNWPEETSSPIKMAGVFGDYVTNPDPNTENDGWAAGLKFGHKKVGAAAKDWQFKYQYVELGKDAWPDSFPDSDRLSGKANVKGNEFILDIGLAKNVTLGLDYYISDVLKGTKNKEKLFQADINFKF